MASVNLSGVLLNPNGAADVGAVVKFTLLTTTGETIKHSYSELIVPPNGAYNIDVVYGILRVDYSSEYTKRFVAIVNVNSDTVATSLPELLNATTPPTDAQLLEFQAILADTVAAKDIAVASAAALDSYPLTLIEAGAVGDGVTDDTAAWATFVANGSGLITPASYLVSGVVKIYTVPTFVVSTLNNHASGMQAFESNTTGYNNTAGGFKALNLNTVGFDNVAYGTQAMRENTTGNRNTAIGVDALAKNTVGDHNLALGQNALGFNTVGTYNTALGIDALEFGLDNNFNTAIGQYAGLNLDNSSNNTVVGYNTLQAATSGNGNVTLGKDTLRDQLAENNNIALGTEAFRENISGNFLIGLGYRAGRTNTTGTHLTYIGDQAGFKNTSGTHNIAIGFTASYENLVGTYNIGIGDSALFLNTGSNNVAIGGFAGYNITTGTQNTFIGHAAGFSGSQKANAVNSTAIGRGAFTTKDNTVQLGNPSVVGVGIGANKIEFLAAVPSTGVWARGDLVINLSVVSLGSFGWQCITAGDFAGTAPVFERLPNLIAL